MPSFDGETDVNLIIIITLKVREPLLFQKGEIEKELRELNTTPDDVSCAAANVVQTLRQRFNKVTPFHHKLLNNAKGIVGVGFNSRADVSTIDIIDSIDVVALFSIGRCRRAYSAGGRPHRDRRICRSRGGWSCGGGGR